MYIKYKGLDIHVTDAAMQELLENDRDEFDVLEILESGYDCARSKRARGTIERCLDKKN